MAVRAADEIETAGSGAAIDFVKHKFKCHAAVDSPVVVSDKVFDLTHDRWWSQGHNLATGCEQDDAHITGLDAVGEFLVQVGVNRFDVLLYFF